VPKKQRTGRNPEWNAQVFSIFLHLRWSGWNRRDRDPADGFEEILRYSHVSALWGGLIHQNLVEIGILRRTTARVDEKLRKAVDSKASSTHIIVVNSSALNWLPF
jgi:hypothetical protein